MFWTFQKEKYTFFQKCSKIGLVAKNWLSLFRGRGVRPQSDKNHFIFFWTLPLTICGVVAFPNIHPTKYVWKISLNSTLDQDLPLENDVSQKSKDDLQGIMCLINIESIFWKDKKTLFNWNYLTRKGIFYWYTSRREF